MTLFTLALIFILFCLLAVYAAYNPMVEKACFFIAFVFVTGFSVCVIAFVFLMIGFSPIYL